MKYLIRITFTLFLVSAHLQTYAQTPGTAQIPEVFLIGEYEDQYLQLSEAFPQSFMSLYANNIDLAYKGWSGFMMDIEDYAADLKFDIRGVKLWINIYFHPDGTVAHVALYPKPNSRNIPEDQLVAFFKNFVRQYHFTETAEQGFRHSASVSFPTFFHRTTPETARSN